MFNKPKPGDLVRVVGPGGQPSTAVYEFVRREPGNIVVASAESGLQNLSPGTFKVIKA